MQRENLPPWLRRLSPSRVLAAGGLVSAMVMTVGFYRLAGVIMLSANLIALFWRRDDR